MWMWFLSLWGRHCSLLVGLKDAYTLVLKGYTVYSEIGVSPQKPARPWHRYVHIKRTHTGSLVYYSSWAVYRTEFFRLNNQLTPSHRKIKKPLRIFSFIFQLFQRRVSTHKQNPSNTLWTIRISKGASCLFFPCEIKSNKLLHSYK